MGAEKRGTTSGALKKENLANLPLGSGQKSASRLDIHDMTVGEWVRGKKILGCCSAMGRGCTAGLIRTQVALCCAALLQFGSNENLHPP